MTQTIAEHRFPSGQICRLVLGDITEEHTDAIVNAANAQLAHGGGVAAAIVRRGGQVIQEQSTQWVREHGPVRHDRPAITSAGRLPSRNVIHAVGPVWGEGEEDLKLTRAVAGSLALAAQRQLVSIALPALSTGIFGFPKPRAAQITLEAIAAFCLDHPDASLREIRVTLFDSPTAEAFQTAFSARWPDSE